MTTAWISEMVTSVLTSTLLPSTPEGTQTATVSDVTTGATTADPRPFLPDKVERTFHPADWVVFALFIGISLGIGIYYGICGGKQTTKDYLMGNRQMSVFPVALSILSAFLSAILILGTPAEVYTRGVMYWMYMFGMCGAVFMSVIIWVPLLYPLKLTSSYEYLEKRFHSRSARLVGTIILIVMQLLYIGVCIYSPATALEAVVNVPETFTIVVGSIVATIYTSLGGMKASVWTSAFQTFVMAAGVLMVVIKGTIDVGGPYNVFKYAREGQRLDFFEFSPDPTIRHTFWTLIVGGTVGWMSTYGVNQASVQRYSSLPTLNKGKLTVLLNIPGLLFFMSICVMSGLVIYAYYNGKVGCDPLSAGYIKSSNQILPYYVMDRLKIPAIPGLLLASLFAGALSSMSSSLSALAAVTWKDLLEWKLHHLSEGRKTFIQKALGVIYGAAGIGTAFMVRNLGGTVLQASLSFTGAAGGPLLGLFFLGGCFPCANWLGAVIGGIVGLAFPLWISFGAYIAGIQHPTKPMNIAHCPRGNLTDMMTTAAVTLTTTTARPPRTVDQITGIERLYTVSYLWYPTIGVLTVVVVGMLVSCVTGLTDPADVEPKYHIPWHDRLFFCLPKKTLEILRCKIAPYDPQEESRKNDDELKDVPYEISFSNAYDKTLHTKALPDKTLDTKALSDKTNINGYHNRALDMYDDVAYSPGTNAETTSL